MTLPPRRVGAFRPARGAPGSTQKSSPPWIDLALLAVAGIVALRPLALFWQADPDYAFGWGVPFLAGYLFFDRWRRQPPPDPPRVAAGGLVAILVLWASAFFLGRLLSGTVPDWRPALWFVASLYLGAVVAWCWLYGGRAWAIHFIFAVAFLFLGVPWLYNLEYPLVQGLMRCNAALVADSLVLADIPARAAGNTLFLAPGQLGIGEACSGIRSLQAALMMGLFLGEFYRFSSRRRGLLLVLALFLALAGNYLRLLFLAVRGVYAGLTSVDAVHDSAASAILAFTIFGLWMGCLALRKRETTVAGEASPPLARVTRPGGNRVATQWAAGLLFAALAGEVATQGWFAWREKSAPPVPSWTVRWPDLGKNYRSIPISAATHELLRDEQGRAGTWRDERGWIWRALWFRYPPRAVNRIAFDAHNPGVCLAAAGLNETADFGEFAWSGRDVSLPVHAYLFSSGAQSEYVFWIAALDRERSDRSAARSPIIYGRSAEAFLGRFLFLSRNAWRGIRAVSAQTLEVSIQGAPDYAQARQAFDAFADGVVIGLPPGIHPVRPP